MRFQSFRCFGRCWCSLCMQPTAASMCSQTLPNLHDGRSHRTSMERRWCGGSPSGSCCSTSKSRWQWRRVYLSTMSRQVRGHILVDRKTASQPEPAAPEKCQVTSQLCPMPRCVPSAVSWIRSTSNVQDIKTATSTSGTVNRQYWHPTGNDCQSRQAAAPEVQWNFTQPLLCWWQHQSFLESDQPCIQLEKPAPQS